MLDSPSGAAVNRSIWYPANSQALAGYECAGCWIGGGSSPGSTGLTNSDTRLTGPPSPGGGFGRLPFAHRYVHKRSGKMAYSNSR